MKPGDKVKYVGVIYSDELEGKIGIIKGKSPDNNTMWLVDFGKGYGEYDCYETSLKRDGQLLLPF